jgi:Periviscerokinin family
VLISYNVGYRGHIDMLVTSFAPPFAVSRRRRDCKPILTEYIPSDHSVPVQASPGNLNTSLARGSTPRRTVAVAFSGCFLRSDAFVSGQVGQLCWSCKPGPGSFDDFSDLQYHVLANGGEFSSITRLPTGEQFHLESSADKTHDPHVGTSGLLPFPRASSMMATIAYVFHASRSLFR